MTQQSTHRGLRAGLALLIATSMAGFATPAFSQTVPVPKPSPVPKPAPKARDGSVQMSAQDKAPSTTGATQTPPNPVIPDPNRNVPANIFATFDANQKAQAARVSSYLSSLQTLVGNFVQVGPDGSKTKGDFYIQKPGKVRFEYDAPSQIAIIADGSSLAVRDTKLAAHDIYISVTIEEKQALIGTSRLMLMVGVKDGQLKQWTVTDPQGYDTTIAVYNLDSSKKVDPGLFKIDFTNYITPAN